MRSDVLAAALVGAVAVGLVGLWLALAATTRPAGGGAAAGRTAVVADAGGRPDAALEAAERVADRSAAVRAPRSSFEAAADLRYFAAQRYGTVVAVGPVARAAARSVAAEYPRTRFVLRAR